MNGRKRHLLVDTGGLVLKVLVHAANINDSKGGRLVMDSVREQFATLRKLWVDKGYQGWYWYWLKLDRDLDVDVMPRGPYRKKRDVSRHHATEPGAMRWRKDAGSWNGHLPG